MSNSWYAADLEAEREHIAALYRRLDDERVAASAELDRALRDGAATDPESRWRREVSVDAASARLNRARAADNGLCFGRLDDRLGERVHIGRTGLFDEVDGYEPLLLDWRAPAARPFYCATAANPEGVSLRRHLHTRGREVLDFHDEVLDPGIAHGRPDTDSALLAAVERPREGAMTDIVATIQAEQDEIIRLDHDGVVVVEGGPGTGKTVVALHRVAYVLYTQRELLSRRGVLVVGPHPGFLRHIDGVLPSLGETGVVFATPGELMPGVSTAVEDPPELKRVKGSAAMVDVLASAVADRQELPETAIGIELDDVTAWLDRHVAEQARERARATGLLHNDARPVFRDSVIAQLTEQAVGRIGAGWLEADDTEVRTELAADVRFELSAHASVHEAVELLWALLTPQRLLAELYGSRQRLAVACDELDESDRELLFRRAGEVWTVSDVALLDESAELLGRCDSDEHRDEGEGHRLEYARGVLEILDSAHDEAHDDGEQLRAVDLVDPERLAARHGEPDHRTTAERAVADRRWTYGHVVLDEAQELSEMDWRVVVRRCPSRSCTVVGDLAQRESSAGARSWEVMLERHVSRRWTYRQLAVNYRTPAEIMELAAVVLAEVDPACRPPTSVRSSGVRPRARRVRRDDLARAVVGTVEDERRRVGRGSVAVITTEDLDLEGVADVLTPHAAKGLEFDVVVLVEPHRVLDTAPHGFTALYVALTRATQRLVVVHTAPLPPVLRGLEPSRRRLPEKPITSARRPCRVGGGPDPAGRWPTTPRPAEASPSSPTCSTRRRDRHRGGGRRGNRAERRTTRRPHRRKPSSAS